MLAIILAAACAQDPLAELVQRTAGVAHFSAEFRMTVSGAPAPAAVRVDYVAPGQVRVDRGNEGKRTSMWSSGGVLALVSNEGERPLAGSVDCGSVYAELDPLEAALLTDFPQAGPRGALGAAVSMRWAFDEKSAKANYTIETIVTSGARTPFGWLETLEQKRAQPTADGELLRFATDGHFDIVVSKVTGMLQEFRGRSPNGDMHLVLQSVDFATPPPAERFALPAPPEGSQDISAELRKSIVRAAELNLRRRMYDAIACAGGPLDGPEAGHGLATLKARSLMRKLHDRTLVPVVGPFLERAAKVREGVAQRLADLKAAGKSPEELKALREKETGMLRQQLDGLAEGLRQRTVPPAGAEGLPNARELLEIESGVLQELLKARVTDPVLAEFEAACDARLR